MPKIILLTMLITFMSSAVAEEIDEYGACLTYHHLHVEYAFSEVSKASHTARYLQVVEAGRQDDYTYKQIDTAVKSFIGAFDNIVTANNIQTLLFVLHESCANIDY